MTGDNIQPCTVCGAEANSVFLLDKSSDSWGCDKIKLYRCQSCNTIYLGRHSESYDDDLYAYYQRYQGKKKEEIYNPLTHKSYLKVLRLFESHGGGTSILDVGCGKGDFVDAALREGYNVEGIDLSQPAVDIAQEFDLPVAKLDFFSSKIHESSKDVLTMFEVIEHLIDPVKFLRRAERVVKPGGLIYLTTPNFNSLDRRMLGKEWDAIHPEHLTYFTPKTLSSAIHSNTSLEILLSENRNLSDALINHLKLKLRKLLLKKEHRDSDAGNKTVRADMRSKIDKSPSLVLLKRVANSILNATSSGSTMVMLLRRPR